MRYVVTVIFTSIILITLACSPSTSQSTGQDSSLNNPIAADELRKAYITNKLEANANFTNKVVPVIGQFYDIELVADGNARAEISELPCSINKDDSLTFKDVSSYDIVTVKGRVTVGEDGSLSLTDCVYESTVFEIETVREPIESLFTKVVPMYKQCLSSPAGCAGELPVESTEVITTISQRMDYEFRNYSDPLTVTHIIILPCTDRDFKTKYVDGMYECFRVSFSFENFGVLRGPRMAGDVYMNSNNQKIVKLSGFTQVR